MLDPVAVALKFGFLAVLYLFLLWTVALGAARPAPHVAATAPGPRLRRRHRAAHGGRVARRPGAAPKLRVGTAAGLKSGAAYDLSQGALLGRGDQADIVLEDSFASTRHARLVPHGDVIVLEDLGSTNGTYLNDEPLRGPQPLHPGDRVRIGDSVFTFER